MEGIATMDGAEIERITSEIGERGYAVAEGLIPDELRDALTGSIDRLMTDLRVPLGGNAFLGHQTRRIFNLLARDPVFESVPVHPGTLPVVERVLDDECLLSSLTAIEMGAADRKYKQAIPQLASLYLTIPNRTNPHIFLNQRLFSPKPAARWPKIAPEPQSSAPMPARHRPR